MRFTIDSNILIYAIDVDTPDKHHAARSILASAVVADSVLTAQALAEFLAVVRRRYPQHLAEAMVQVERWSELFPIAPTTATTVGAAARFSAAYGLQIWDCVIWQAALENGAAVFVSEDLQDGFSMDGMTVLDPFAPANATRLADLLEETADPT